MTENNNNPPTGPGWVYRDEKVVLRLEDASVWGTEEITDLRNKFIEVQAESERRRELLNRRLRELTGLQARVRDAFRELVGDDALDIDHANEALEDLGLEKLAVEYEWNATVELRGYGKAPDAESLESAIENATYTIEAYEDGVEDVEVDEATVSTVSSDRVR